MRPICGLVVSLPFGPTLDVDTRFWSRVAEVPLRVPIRPELANRARRAAVPLRWSGPAASPTRKPRVEAHLHRFGIVAIVTIDLDWTNPVPIEEAWEDLRLSEDSETKVTVNDKVVAASLGGASQALADDLIDSIADGQNSAQLASPTYRVVTVISGTSDTDLKLPTSNSWLHIALHRLAGGSNVVAAPSLAFVPQWSDAGYEFSPERMMYALSVGSASLMQSALGIAPGDMSASDWHRERLLLTAYVSALADLVQTAPESRSGQFRAWAKLAALALGRLYGPDKHFLEWGKFPAALLDKTGASDALRTALKALDKDLYPNAEFPVTPFPQTP
ncbi:hypothetical protein [Agromyces bauzanensis]